MTDSIDINPNYLAIIQSILSTHVPDCEVRAFGSRAKWTARDYSDIDLVIVGGGPMDRITIGRLQEAFEESSLPTGVDVLDWYALSRDFRKVIERDCVVVQYGISAGGGVLQSEWRRVVLGDLIDLQLSSVDKKSKADEQTVKLCNYTDVYNNSFIHAGIDFMTATATEREILQCSLIAGDVVITKDSEKHDDIGVPALVREDVPNLVCGYHLAILRPRLSEADGMYLFYALSTDETQQQFHSFANGITRFGLRKADIGLVEIPLPPLHEQRAIARILSTLDDKIELNRRMNETLEQMARALFKSWFVDFDPVRAKVEGRWRRGESLPGLPAEHYDLFSDRLVDSELGEIPEGWEVKALGDCFNVAMGQSPPGSTYNEEGEGLPFFQGNADFGFRYPEQSRYCTAPTRIASADDTLVSVRAPVGAINMAWEECCIGRGVAALRHNSGSASFAYYYMRVLQEEIRQYEHTGTVFGAITKRQFEALRVIDPPPDLIDCFERQVQVLDRCVRSNASDSRNLTDQRDALLPKLVSGEVRVP